MAEKWFEFLKEMLLTVDNLENGISFTLHKPFKSLPYTFGKDNTRISIFKKSTFKLN